MGIKAKLKIKKDWLYEGGGKNSFAISKFINGCKSKFGDGQVQEENKTFDECCICIETDEGTDNLRKALDTILKENARVESPDVYTLTIGDEEVKTSPEVQESTEEKDASDVMGKINGLIGAESFKVLCKEIHDRSELIIKNNTRNIFFSETYLFSINSGEGYTHSLDLFMELLKKAGLFDSSVSNEIKEIKLPDKNDPQVSEKMERLIWSLKSGLGQGGIISYDITPWLGHTSSEDFKKLLMCIFKNNKGCVNVFKIPVVPDHRIKETLSDINDILSVSSVYYKPFEHEEMQKLAKDMFTENDIIVENSVWDIFDKKIDEERHDGNFYGINTVKKIVNEMIRHMEIYNVNNNDNTNTLTADKVKGILAAEETDSVPGEKELEALIGIETVKEQVRSIIRHIELLQEKGAGKKPAMHMCFTGNPGTGKTTVARIIGKILKEKNILRIGKFFEYSGRELCGQYVGWTAKKTSDICKEAYGSVLFIDEAYSLYREDNDRDYGKEVIDTLISEMENNSDDLVVIFAGYPEEMQTMLTGNAGMKSRIPYTIDFPDYTGEELAEIFFKMAANVTYDEGLAARVNEYFTGIPEEKIHAKDFGNARFVRNVFERTQGKAMIRTADSGEDELKFTVEDFDVAVKEMEEKDSFKKNPIGF